MTGLPLSHIARAHERTDHFTAFCVSVQNARRSQCNRMRSIPTQPFRARPLRRDLGAFFEVLLLCYLRLQLIIDQIESNIPACQCHIPFITVKTRHRCASTSLLAALCSMESSHFASRLAVHLLRPKMFILSTAHVYPCHGIQSYIMISLTWQGCQRSPLGIQH